MVHTCNVNTDLNELIGSEHLEGQQLYFHYGPLALAMMGGEELVLENSGALSPLMLKKVSLIQSNLLIEETAEVIHPEDGFRLSLR